MIQITTSIDVAQITLPTPLIVISFKLWPVRMNVTQTLSFIQTIPTIGFNVETVEYKNLKFTIWDVGGQPKLRPLWKHYYLNTQAVIYVIDSSDESRLTESHDELVKLISEKVREREQRNEDLSYIL